MFTFYEESVHFSWQKIVPAEFDGETLRFHKPVKKPAAGQSAVFYDGEICLGGGLLVNSLLFN